MLISFKNHDFCQRIAKKQICEKIAEKTQNLSKEKKKSHKKCEIFQRIK